ncbi:hypothetical protein PsYK624_118400 [Phanerochaete sordida]|uniref:Uncharacterized protein n=1 Tax=Phanerochaete sordida TaxID=48140 RepID=A0A9P3GJY5_9APHY|nr:hypothetical protein PsYK624_118400 [Phanerochaete sordida]
MSSRKPTLPPEILHTVISQAIARHLDDILVETSSSLVPPSDTDTDNEIEAPVVAASLLAASCQMRHIALIVLSKALGIALSRVGIWRLEGNPWAAIHSVRLTLRRTYDFNGYRDIIDNLDPQSESTESPVLSVYFCIHLIAEVFAHPFGPLVIPVAGQEPRTVSSDWFARYFEIQAQKYFEACPPAFQEVIFPRLDAVRAESLIARTCGRVMPTISAAWERLEDFASRVDSESPRASVLDRTIRNIVGGLEDLRTEERNLLRSWPHTITADAAIGVGRLTKWFSLFCDMAEWEYDSESAQTLREIAQDIADDYHARFVALHRLARAKEEKLAECSAAIEREGYTAIAGLRRT